MSKNLVIVESPAKAKTIEGYLGKDFIVKSSYGHVRDLPKSDKAIDIANGFKPYYEISSDKKALIAELSSLVKSSDTIWLATDDDREGEAISWHLKETLGIDDAKTKRIVFREITKTAIQKAIQTPRSINIDLVNAQQARRILDRLVGFELSPVLWKKIKAGLSAGRVQSVAVRIIVEREREISRFSSVSHFKVNALFGLENDKELQAERPDKFDTEQNALDFVNRCIDAVFTIKNLEKKPAKRSPAPPFTTSTLQQEASRKLGFSVSQTMSLAQRLYEAGHISYMRTDSVNLSEDAIKAASATIAQSFGNQYVEQRRFKTKLESAQEAHEAIRPTNFGNPVAGTERNEQRLYELIWKRAIASQMADAQLEKTVATVGISTMPDVLIATGEVIKFDGFLKVYMESTDDDEEAESKGMLPPLSIGQVLNLKELKARERFTTPPPRYTEASLVKKLEEMGIGRPSTYAPTISTIMKREYVIKENREGKERNYREIVLAKGKVSVSTKSENYGAEKAKLFPTDIGMVVNDFLVKYFSNIVDFSFTATVEEEFDKIADGQIQWEDMIKNFYEDFHQEVERTEQDADRSTASARKIGTDPKTGKEVVARLGRYGPVVQIGGEGDEKPQFASLRKGQFIESITLEEALELFKLPRELGEYEGKTITAALGRYGAYLKVGEQNYSLGKNQDPLELTLEEAIRFIKEQEAKELGSFEGHAMSLGKGRFGEYVKHAGAFYSLPKGVKMGDVNTELAIQIIKDKRIADEKKVVKRFEERPEIVIMNTRFGAILSDGKQKIKLPKAPAPESLTLEQCVEMLSPKTKNTASAKTKTAKSTSKADSGSAKSTKSGTAAKTSSRSKK